MSRPTGIRFPNDDSSYLLCTEGEWKGWVFEYLDDGRWVSLKKPSADDLTKIAGYCLYDERREQIKEIRNLRDELYPEQEINP